MKILSTGQIREADAYTIAKEPIRSVDLMERAAEGLFRWIIGRYDPRRRIAVICGTGNNGGDGLALARMLHEHGYHVEVYTIKGSAGGSEDFEINAERLPVSTHNIEVVAGIADFSAFDILIDAIFGTGLSRPVEGVFADVIAAMNNSGAEVISIDIPSGMFADVSTGDHLSVHASVTLTFQVPKLAFLMPENGIRTGEWHVIGIGLDKGFINGCKSDYELITEHLVDSVIPVRNKFAHKGDFGRALIMAGSYGKIGAAVLAGRAALRSGAGLLTMYIPRSGYPVLQTAVPEAMVLADDNNECITGIPETEGFSAIGIGPGIGTAHETVYALEELLRRSSQPLVLDADALNLLALHNHLQDLIPDNTILTPHPGEFQRLAGTWNNDFERLEKQVSFSKEHSCIIVLKGAHTSVSLPDGRIFFNTTGNPGMATGGSGDVLTGILTALLAQRLPAADAALAGVYIHGLAGDIAEEYNSAIAMTAGDIIENLTSAFLVFPR